MKSIRMHNNRYILAIIVALIFLYSIKPSIAFLSDAISYCFIRWNIESPSLYKFFGSPITGFALVIVSALVLTCFMYYMLMMLKEKSLFILGIFGVLLLPFQFSNVNILANMCFKSGDDVSVCKGWVFGKEIPSEPNSLIIAVKQKGIGYPPYAIFNGFDIDGYTPKQIDDIYVLQIWLNKAARARLSHILSKQASIGYVVIHHGEIHYINDVDFGIQKNGMYFLYYDTSKDVVDNIMCSSMLTPLTGCCASKRLDDRDGIVYRDRILNFDKFIENLGNPQNVLMYNEGGK